MSRTILTLLALSLSVSLAVAARVRLEPDALEVGRVRDPTWLPDGRVVRIAAMGQQQLLADAYWLKSVQYMGEMAIRDGDWRALLPLADITTDLDPRFGYVYQVVGSNLAGLAHRSADADRILLKGMRNVPDRWSLPWTFAVNKFLYDGDFATAAEYARRAATVGNRPQLALLAANLSLAVDEDGQYAQAEQVLSEAIGLAGTDALRADLEARLVKVRTYAVLSRIERAAAAFERRLGRRPLSIYELVAERFLPELPADPAGGVFTLDLATGKPRSSVLGAREPLRPPG